jgi:hypothetical protein
LIVGVVPLLHLHEGDNLPLEVVKHADLHWMKEVSLKEVAHNSGKMSRHVETSVNMAQREISFGHIGVGIVECSK